MNHSSLLTSPASSGQLIDLSAPVAFKEWALVCDSMLAGETSLIFRKGGIAEGREGFRFQHSAFFLFPTFFHAQAGQVRGATALPSAPADGCIRFPAFATVEFTRWADDLRKLEPLEPFHRLQPEVLEQRFAYDDVRGLHVAMVRIYAVEPALEISDRPGFGGCRSWVRLPNLIESPTFRPVLSDTEHERRVALVKLAVGS
ncbi:MAG: DUF1802 family protein [Verrucomicrobia bacterium]|nr:DUF1802 family protein [Verrucomicrobiota bacterium]